VPSSENHNHHPQTKKNVQPGDEFKNTAVISSRSLKLSNFKTGCRVSALHFFVKHHQGLSDKTDLDK
jgi:hypothetical protein